MGDGYFPVFKLPIGLVTMLTWTGAVNNVAYLLINTDGGQEVGGAYGHVIRAGHAGLTRINQS